MNSSSTARGDSATPPQAAWWTGYVLLMSLPLVLLARRLGGAFQQPLTTPVIVGAAIVVILLSQALRISATKLSIGLSRPTLPLVFIGLMSATCLVFLISVTVSGTPITGAVLAWCCVVAAETYWWTSYLREPRDPVPARPNEHAPPSWAASPAEATTLLAGGPLEDSLPPHVTQHLMRTRAASGEEKMYGALRLTFAPGEQRQATHIVFCPPWTNMPEFQIEQTEGPDADLDVTQVAPYGARVEAKLTEPAAQEVQIVVQFEAVGVP